MDQAPTLTLLLLDHNQQMIDLLLDYMSLLMPAIGGEVKCQDLLLAGGTKPKHLYIFNPYIYPIMAKNTSYRFSKTSELFRIYCLKRSASM